MEKKYIYIKEKYRSWVQRKFSKNQPNNFCPSVPKWGCEKFCTFTVRLSVCHPLSPPSVLKLEGWNLAYRVLILMAKKVTYQIFEFFWGAIEIGLKKCQNFIKESFLNIKARGLQFFMNTARSRRVCLFRVRKIFLNKAWFFNFYSRRVKKMPRSGSAWLLIHFGSGHSPSLKWWDCFTNLSKDRMNLLLESQKNQSWLRGRKFLH